MIKKLLNTLLGIERTKDLKKNAEPDNVVDARNKLFNAVVEYFKQQFFGQKEFTDIILIWVSNNQPAYQNFIRDKTFEKNLRLKLENSELEAISKANIEFKTENPPQELGLFEIIEGVYIQLVASKQKEVPAKAKISIINNKGSLMKYEYTLDAAIQTEYNIGRGEGNYNHIVIKENDPMHNEINNCVSREHAKIVFVSGTGFCLELRNKITRTIINHNNQRIRKLETLGEKSLLQNNDVIELGDKNKPLLLKFKIVDVNTENKIQAAEVEEQ